MNALLVHQNRVGLLTKNYQLLFKKITTKFLNKLEHTLQSGLPNYHNMHQLINYYFTVSLLFFLSLLAPTP